MTGCSLLGDDKKEVPFKNPVYANVFFEKTHKNGAPVHGIVAINYDNPKEFKLLASGKSAYNNLRLSPDGEKLIYTDKYETGLGSVPQHGLFNTRTGKKELLFQIFEGEKVELVGHESIDVVWNMDSEGFYFTNPAQSFSALQSVFYYNLKTRKVEIIKGSPPFAIYPHDIISSDTLIVFSNEFETLEFYLMGIDGKYIYKINNSFISGINEDGITKRGVFDLAWNDSLSLIAAGYINGDKFDGYKIIVTDLEGKVFNEFGNGSYLNSNPMWTKDGNLIFTERRNLYNNQINSELKKIDLETGEITPFFSRREYPQITGIGTSDQ
ncbi:hypothetical protein [Gracilimonas sp.]|uniref:hypothetical protein n=1 Tax=Gracilimonas sp. TaxID=1974203 RepID=UPI0032EBC3F0